MSNFYQGGVKFEKTKYCFGTVSQDSIVIAEFKFSNLSDKLLKLKINSTSCNCTNSFLSVDSIKPKESGILILELDTKNKNGKVAINAVLEANTEQKFHRVILYGDVRKEI